MSDVKNVDNTPDFEVVLATKDYAVGVMRKQDIYAANGNMVNVSDVIPALTWKVTDNLYGRIMTLLEAVAEKDRLKAIKDIFGKELKSWEHDVYLSAKEIANNGDSSENIYTRNR